MENTTKKHILCMKGKYQHGHVMKTLLIKYKQAYMMMHIMHARKKPRKTKMQLKIVRELPVAIALARAR